MKLQKIRNFQKEAGIKNDTKWNAKTAGFLQNTENFKNWMNQRILWMDEQMVTVDRLLESWGTFHSNQESGSVISIENVEALEDGVKVGVLTESSGEIGVYINGLKYAKKASDNKQLEVVIPYENLKNMEKTKALVVVRTMHQGPSAQVSLAEVRRQMRRAQWYMI